MSGQMVIEAPDLSAIAGIRHAFFTRQGGVSGGIYASLNGGLGSRDNQADIAENRSRMAAYLGVQPSHLLGVHQVHSPTAVIVDRLWIGPRPEADALVTRTRGLALGVSSADCGPILFVDQTAGVIGAAHSGWKGSFLGVGAATLAAMESLGARRADTIAVLGPTIGRDAYEVGPEFVARFAEADQRFFRPSPRADHAWFDLPAFIADRLIAAGVGRFVDLGLCTYGDEQRFYSYRRTTHRNEPDYGRLIAAITLA